MRKLEADRATLLVGEALEGLLTLEPGTIDALISDPPYSSGGMFRGDRMGSTVSKYVSSGAASQETSINFDGDNRDQHAYGYWCALWLAKARELAKPGAPICIFTDWRQISTTIDAVQAGGWVYRGLFVWDKTGACRPVQGRFAPQCEFVVWGSNGPMPVHRDAPTLLGCMAEPAPRERVHVTQKPLKVMRYLATICERGGLVLDPFAGSGTTGVAALLEGFRFIGIESNAEIAELAWKRLNGLPAQVGSSSGELFA